MTSFAFIAAMIPLIIGEGAGAEMRRSLRTAVFFGMLGVTLFGIFLSPVFYYAIMGLTSRRQPVPVAISPSSRGEGRPGPEPSVPGQGVPSEQIKKADPAVP